MQTSTPGILRALLMTTSSLAGVTTRDFDEAKNLFYRPVARDILYSEETEGLS